MHVSSAQIVYVLVPLKYIYITSFRAEGEINLVQINVGRATFSYIFVFSGSDLPDDDINQKMQWNSSKVGQSELGASRGPLLAKVVFHISIWMFESDSGVTGQADIKCILFAKVN